VCHLLPLYHFHYPLFCWTPHSWQRPWRCCRQKIVQLELDFALDAIFVYRAFNIDHSYTFVLFPTVNFHLNKQEKAHFCYTSIDFTVKLSGGASVNPLACVVGKETSNRFHDFGGNLLGQFVTRDVDGGADVRNFC